MSDENEFLDLVSDLKGQLESRILLEEIHKQICSCPDLDVIVTTITESACKLLDCERATVFVVERSQDSTGRELVSRKLMNEEVKEIRVPFNHASLAGYTACTGQMLSIHDVYDEEELYNISPLMTFDRSWDERTGYRSKSMLVAPAKNGEYIVGVLQALNKRSGDAFTQEDEAHLVELAQYVASAIENAQSQTRVLNRARKRLSINEMLIEKKLIVPEKMEVAVQKAREERRKLLDLLVEDFGVPEEGICRCLAELNGLEYYHFDQENITDPILFEAIPEAYCKRHFICPIRLVFNQNGKPELQLAMNNPKDFVALEDVEIRTGYKINQIFMTTRVNILQMLRAALHPNQPEEEGEDMGALLSELNEELGILGTEENIEAVDVEEGATENEGPIVRLSNRVIEEAVRKGATDIHIEPKDDVVLVRYRIDGSLEKALTFPAHAKRAIVSRYKIMADCNITEHRVPQDGRISFKQFGGRYDIELRVNICPTVGGNEDIVMRILADSKPLPLDKLGLMSYVFDPVHEAVSRPYGMILCVGPTGSGKTTTLHSMVSYINTPDRKILTAENPVEITQDGLRQVQIKSEVGLTFKEALRAFLRQDPDVILVGEMRDFETCSIAVEAALTGHLLLSTLHTNNAPETITRLVDIGIDRVTLSDALLCVLAQRLAKTLCKTCKKAWTPEGDDRELLEETGVKFLPDGSVEYLGDVIQTPEFYTAVGCPACQARGYKGRMGIHELLNVSEEVKRIVATGGKIEDIRNTAKSQGMRELYEDGIIKVLHGRTNIHQVRAVCIE